jgi:uncharacterized membrane protein
MPPAPDPAPEPVVAGRPATEAAAGWVRRLPANLSFAGLLVGALFFALSLTPSLIPRPAAVQGILSGCLFAVGYAVGAVLLWFWTYLELRPSNPRIVLWMRLGAAIAVGVVVALCLYHYVGWQNAVRAAMHLGPLENAHLLWTLVLALLPATLLVLLGTLLTHSVQRVAALLRRAFPRRAATLAAIVIVGILTAMLFSGVLLRGALRTLDEFFEQLDAVAGQFGDPAPGDPLRSGSALSLVDWSTIGRDGRLYVQIQPLSESIAAVTGRSAMTPLRTYVGLRSAEGPRERAELALAEMERIGSFDRSTLVIIMPVGTGWVDPPSIAALEYLLDGDVASVAVQYSYLSSPLSLVVEPSYGTDAAQALFDVVYGYWRRLPAGKRPRLFLNGLSLGANSSQASTLFLDVLADPFDGALWVGPPYTSMVWRWATANRVPGSPEWRPLFGDSSSVRFANRGEELSRPGGPWGPMRIAFLQYPSDPIVFFHYASIFDEPDWMEGERGEGVSSAFQWYPIITFLQLAMDMALANTSPIGFGHLYSAEDYVDAWYALVEPVGWDKAGLARLKAELAPAVDRQHPGL